MRAVIPALVLGALGFVVAAGAATNPPPPVVGQTRYVAPADNGDLHAIRSTAEAYSAAANACLAGPCPQVDCARGREALQGLADLEAHLRAVTGHLRWAALSGPLERTLYEEHHTPLDEIDKEIARTDARDGAAQAALDAVRAAMQALAACLAKAGCGSAITLTRPPIPQFQAQSRNLKITDWEAALAHFDDVLPALHQRLPPPPAVTDRVPCDKSRTFIQPFSPFGGPGVPFTLDLDSTSSCPWGSTTVPFTPAFVWSATPTPPPGSAPPPPPRLTFTVEKTVQEGGVIGTIPMTDGQILLSPFPAPDVPGPDAVRDEATGSDRPPTRAATDANGRVSLEDIYRGALFPEEPFDLTPTQGMIIGHAPAPPFSLPPVLSGLRVRTFDVGGTTLEVLQYPDFLAPAVGRWAAQVPNTLFVEENKCREIQAGADPYFASRSSWKQAYDDQWAIKRVGFTGAPGSASELAGGAAPVVVAVLDTGLDWNHEDIPWEALWKNPKEVAGNGVDDDKNGFVDDVIGWDFWRQTNKPWDRNGHGTLVAGIIAARSDNGRGIAGVNPQARVMVLKALNSFGHTRASYIAEAIVYAADNGARVVNISVGGKERTRTEQMAIEYAEKKGVVMVVASGNEGVAVSDFGPGGVEQVVTVAATGVDDKRAKYSNWGAGIDVAAPGDDVLGPRARYTDLRLGIAGVAYKPGDGFVGADRRYYRASGTSFAAPIVSGVASLLIGKNAALAPAEVKRLLLHNARDIDVPGVDQFTGYGLLDATAALRGHRGFFLEAAISGVKVVSKGGKPYVQVLGTAAADRLASAWIEIGAGDNPAEWQRASRDITAAVTKGALEDIDAQLFRASKVWTLRLVVAHQDGWQREARFLLKLG